MQPDARLASTVALGRRFVDALVAHDWQGVADCFEPEGRFLAVVANEELPFREKIGGEAAADQIRKWFGDADVTEFDGQRGRADCRSRSDHVPHPRA